MTTQAQRHHAIAQSETATFANGWLTKMIKARLHLQQSRLTRSFVVALVYSHSKNKHLLARLEPLAQLRPAELLERRDEERVVRSLHFRLTHQQRAALVTDYESGLATTELTTRYGLAKGTVLRLLEEAGVAMRRQGLSENLAENARLLYESGLSVAAVGERLGEAPTSVARALRRIGVTLRPGRRT